VSSPPRTRRILLAEDDRFLRRACEAAIRQRGFAIEAAPDGAAALEAARRERPDLVLLDMLMPRLSGLEVLRALRADPAMADVPVLILSNSSREQDVAEVTRLGIIGYWVKSNLSLRELGDRVVSFFEGEGGGGG
jgi:DNA-binding response OmpR family regulator